MSNVKKTYYFFVFILLTSCSEKLLEKPDNLISKDKMVEVLKDLAIVNAAKSTNVTVLRDNNIEPMAYIFEKHGIDSVQFVESDKYYASLPVEYERIYKEVEAKLEKEHVVLQSAKKVKDSLRLMKQEKERLERQKASDSLAQTSQKKAQ